MIEFHKDNLVPARLCRLLHEVVPKRYHVPVRFHNRRIRDYGGGSYPYGTLYSKGGVRPAYIDINLNPIYSSREPATRGFAPSTALWRLLLEVCLHEFGHVATMERILKMNRHEHHALYGHGRVYRITEHLADEWRDRRITRILEADPRLEQPRYMTGYFGARLAQWGAYAEEQKKGGALSGFVKERRCQRTGGQLSSGDVLGLLDADPYFYANAYAALREASDGVGIDYVDGTGRRHKLYIWGDVPILAERLGGIELRKKARFRTISSEGETGAGHSVPRLAW